MIKFSIPEGFLRVCEQKEAYLISFFLQDSADGRGQRPRRHGAGAILGWLMLGQVLKGRTHILEKVKGEATAEAMEVLAGGGGFQRLQVTFLIQKF